MDFFKKNWGFLAIAAVSFVMAIAIIVYWFKANKTLAEHRAETAKQLEFFDRVKASNIKLSEDNIAVTESNLRVATEHFNSLQASLAQHSHIEPEVPPTPLEAVRVLKSEIAALRKALTDANVLFAPTCAYFTFDNIAMRENLPHKDDLFQIFRQLAIIKEVCRILPLSGISSLDSLVRPLDLVVQEEDIYTYTPLEIVATGSAESIQKLLNLINNEAKYLFFIRTIDITAADQFTDLGAGLAITQELALSGGMDAARGGMGMGARGGMGMGARAGMGMGGRAGMGMDGMDAGMGMDGMDGMAPGRRRPGIGIQPGMDGQGTLANAAMLPPPKRQDYLVFAPKQVTLNVRLDLIEFNALTTTEGN
ncbi:MAG: hypothetical protein GX945_10270 [Lentisphaerae bacterium]|nr:hypothetical protein [Lentisphaerota bacterium]